MKTTITVFLALLSTAPAFAAEWKAWDCELLDEATQNSITADVQRAASRGEMAEFVGVTHLTSFKLVTKDARVFRGSLTTSHQGGPHFARQRSQVAASTAFAFTSSSVNGSTVQATLENIDRNRDSYVYEIQLNTTRETARVRESYSYNTRGVRGAPDTVERGKAVGEYQCKRARVVINNQDVGSP